MNEEKIREIEERLARLPHGTLTYKTIKGKKQPYLQSTSQGRSVSHYIRLGERELLMEQLKERTELQDELKRLRAYHEKTAAILADNPFFDRKPGIGYQDFEMLMERRSLYVDKTHFIEEWWESDEQVTLITRPRRFGKTLLLSTVNCFFSNRYLNRADLFTRLRVWKNKSIRVLQGQFPVIFVSLAGVKGENFQESVIIMCHIFSRLFGEYEYLIKDDCLSETEKKKYTNCEEALLQCEEYACCRAVFVLSELLYHYYGKKVMILLDEYDTPMQEAYLYGYWEDMVGFMRKFFNLSLKSNAYLERALLTGITRVAKESMFSDFNQLSVHTVTSHKYSDCFGFTEQELFDCLECHDIQEKQEVKLWYDGFTIGGRSDIYNPWSIVNYLSERKFLPYWAHSGGYGLADRLIRLGKNSLKKDLEILLKGGSIHKILDENVNFQELENSPDAVWSLLLAAGYVKADRVTFYGTTECDLSITNRETVLLFDKMVQGWFASSLEERSILIRALKNDDIETMNQYMNCIALDCISAFDVGGHPSERTPERFYHGFVLGLLVELRKEYEIRSNRESGYGRYDIMMIPRQDDLNAVIIEFKVHDAKKEADLQQTAENAVKQIAEKKYAEELLSRGIEKKRIRTYGFGFEGKEVLILRGM